MINCEEKELLLNIPLFSGFSEDDINKFLSSTKNYIEEYPKDAIPILRGDSIKSIAIVLRGRLLGQIENQEGQIMTINYLDEGSVFGDVLSGSSGKSPVTVYANTECRLLWLDLSSVLNARSSDKQINRFLINFIREISDKYFALNERIQILSERRLRNKVLSFIKLMYQKQQSYDIVLPFRLRNDWSNYLGCDRTALAREISMLEDEGFLSVKGNRIKVTQKLIDS